MHYFSDDDLTRSFEVANFKGLRKSPAFQRVTNTDPSQTFLNDWNALADAYKQGDITASLYADQVFEDTVLSSFWNLTRNKFNLLDEVELGNIQFKTRQIEEVFYRFVASIMGQVVATYHGRVAELRLNKGVRHEFH